MKQIFSIINADSVKSVWKNLNRTIYVGERFRSNMLALTFVSIVTAVLGFSLIVIDIFSHQFLMIIPSIITMVAGIACAYFSDIKKNRKAAIIIPTVFCAIAFTLYAFGAIGKGSAILWSLLLPIGISYFVNVKYGILLSAYHNLLFAVIFYTPLNKTLSQYYTVVTLETGSKSMPDLSVLEKAMYYMEQSIKQTIRGVDIVTKYNSYQFLIIFIGSDNEGVKKAMDRIFRGYYKMNVSGAFTPSYTIADSDESTLKGTV
ncbi:MAG: hypothetical protein K6E98_01255 [Lachnospiraceae bacterium]|nr:hypothetical protein [Lachnospiraceae bacterium]